MPLIAVLVARTLCPAPLGRDLELASRDVVPECFGLQRGADLTNVGHASFRDYLMRNSERLAETFAAPVE